MSAAFGSTLSAADWFRFGDPLWVAAQIFGVISFILTFISFQTESPKKLILIQTGATCANMLSYLCLGAMPGVALYTVCVVRNLIYFFREKKIFSYRFWPWLLAGIMGLLGFLSWDGPISLLVISALVINTVILSLRNNRILRISILFTSTEVIIYNLIVGSYGGCVSEAIAVVSSAIGLIRFRKNKEQPAKEQENG